MKLTQRLKLIATSLRLATGDKNLIVGEDFYKIIEKLCYIRDDINGKIETIEGGELIPSSDDQIIKGGKYLSDNMIIKGDENLKSENIRRSKDNKRFSLFGVEGELETLRKFNGDMNTNKYYGEIVSDVARSYHLAKLNGVSFKYHDQHGILRDGLLTDENGNCYVDCSSFISLVLRGIPFNKSPYANVIGKPNQKTTNKTIYELTSKSDYEFSNIFLDLQTDDNLKDIGVQGYKSISNAGVLAEYYYSQGRTLFDFKTSPSTVPNGLQAGDLIFWSKPTASDNQKARFKGVSHVGIVARDKDKYIHVTGSNNEKGDTVFYSNIIDHLEYITLIVRPNYQPIDKSTPLNVNLLTNWGYDNCNVGSSYTTNNVEFKPKLDGGFTITKKSTTDKSASFYLHKSSNPIKLTPGVYEISGTPINDNASQYRKTRDWGLMVKGVNGDIINDEGIEVLDKGNGDTFTIEKDTDVYILFYVSANVDSQGLVCKPILKKKSRLNTRVISSDIEIDTSSDWTTGKISNGCLRVVKGWEGYYDYNYQDCEGYWTIGYGTCLHSEKDIYNNLKSQVPVSEKECAKALYNLLCSRYGAKIVNVAKELGITKQYQFDAMASLSYNCGYGIFTNKSSNLYKTMKKNINDTQAIKEAWEKTAITGASTGNVLSGLVKRRQIEAKLFAGEDISKDVWPITHYSKVDGKKVIKTFSGDGWLPN